MRKHKHHLLSKAIDRFISMPYGRLFMAYALVIILFGLAYLELHAWSPSNAPSLPGGTRLNQFYNAMYFSVITATSVGYGDIVPHGISKILAGVESIGALFLFTMLVSKTISYRQELALTQVHTLTFNDIFTNVREGFFLARRDFDEMMNLAPYKAELTPRHWHNLAVAYRHCSSLFESIPEFYAGVSGLYTIDVRREQLLVDAVERTLIRLNDMLDAFKKNHIDWKHEAESEAEFKSMLEISTATIRLWEKASPYQHKQHFDQIKKAAARLATA